jgi:glycosyltransferase involved in cell wall biosynthesis
LIKGDKGDEGLKVQKVSRKKTFVPFIPFKTFVPFFPFIALQSDFHYSKPVPPLITVYIPTYEPEAEHLTAALESLQKQTFQDWEAIVHDDASLSDVREMISRFRDDPRIMFQKNRQRQGIGGNWNASLRHGSGTYVQYLFQDDMWKPEYLEKMVEALEKNPSAGFASAQHQYVIEGYVHPDAENLYRELEKFREMEVEPGIHTGHQLLQWWMEKGLRPNFIGEPSFVMLRRSLMESVGKFREDMPQGLDTEYWLRCLLKADWYFERTSLGMFRVHGQAASARNDREGLGLYDRLGFYDTLLHLLPAGYLREDAKKSLTRHFSQMIAKFFKRRKEGGKTSAGGARSVLHMAMRHPILLLRGAFAFFVSSFTR